MFASTACVGEPAASNTAAACQGHPKAQPSNAHVFASHGFFPSMLWCMARWVGFYINSNYSYLGGAAFQLGEDSPGTAEPT